MVSKNWIKRIIYFQEKRSYHFYTIVIFALFVGVIRSLEEVLLAHRLYLDLHVYNNCAFYFLMIWAFTFIVSLLAPIEWRKAVYAVLIGVFLGIFPPLIDVFVYGVGRFRYSYFLGFPNFKQLLFFDPTIGYPAGETIILWSSIGFTGYYVYLKTASWFKSFAGLVLAYLFLLNSGWIIPSLSEILARFFNLPSMILISLLQLVLALTLYLALNYRVAYRLLARSIHCLPFVLLTMIGAALSGGIKPISYFMSFLVFLAGITTLAQNDFFDKKEDELAGRTAYIDRQDVIFCNAILIAIIMVLNATGGYIHLPLLLLFICGVLYNYDFYRAKRFFPGNYKIEGIWGLGSFLAGVMSQSPPNFSKEILIFSFLVFGGWSLVSTFKDYKDIEADRAVGNQTGYIILMKMGLNLRQAHYLVMTVITACFFVPAVWMFFQSIPRMLVIVPLFIAIGGLLLQFNKPPSRSVVRNILLVTCAYLFIILILLGNYYVPAQLPQLPVGGNMIR